MPDQTPNQPRFATQPQSAPGLAQGMDLRAARQPRSSYVTGEIYGVTGGNHLP